MIDCKCGGGYHGDCRAKVKRMTKEQIKQAYDSHNIRYHVAITALQFLDMSDSEAHDYLIPTGEKAGTGFRPLKVTKEIEPLKR